MQAKRSCQAAKESTTLRTFTQPLPGRMKSCYTSRNVAIMLSCTSNLAGTWCASSTSAACWGARVAGLNRPFARSGPNTFTPTTTKLYKTVRLRQPEVYTGKYLGPDDLIVLRPVTLMPCGRKRKARFTWKEKQRGPPTTTPAYGAITHAHYESVLEFF